MTTQSVILDQAAVESRLVEKTRERIRMIQDCARDALSGIYDPPELRNASPEEKHTAVLVAFKQLSDTIKTKGKLSPGCEEDERHTKDSVRNFLHFTNKQLSVMEASMFVFLVAQVLDYPISKLKEGNYTPGLGVELAERIRRTMLVFI